MLNCARRAHVGISRSILSISAAAVAWNRSFASSAAASSFYDFSVKDADGNQVSLRDTYGDTDVILVTNVASKCGLTQSNYRGLKELQKEFEGRSFTVLGFPSDNFMNQEYAEDSQIQEFAKKTMGANFPVMAKVDVNGANTADVFAWLKSQNYGGQPIAAISWNFSKFLVVQGQVIERYAPTTPPASIRGDIERELTRIELASNQGGEL